VCASEAPEVFELDEESGEFVLLQEQPPQDLRSKVELAVKYCPTRALLLEEA
jgi:ferredoxin